MSYEYNDKYSPYNVCGYVTTIDAGVLTLDFTKGTTAIVAHDANITSVNIINGPIFPDNVGEHTIYLTQDATGSRTLVDVTGLGNAADTVNIVSYLTADTGITFTGYLVNNAGSAGGAGAGAGRTTGTVATSTIADGAIDNVEITGALSYSLMKVQVDQASWVRIYKDGTSRTADAGRAEGTDPLSAAGVIAEVITASAGTVNLTPAIIGWNDDATPTTTIYLSIKNKSGSTATINTTLTYVSLES